MRAVRPLTWRKRLQRERTFLIGSIYFRVEAVERLNRPMRYGTRRLCFVMSVSEIVLCYAVAVSADIWRAEAAPGVSIDEEHATVRVHATAQV